jgi:hypothetical protein
MNALWKCVYDNLTGKVYYVDEATPQKEIEAICECCDLDWPGVRDEIKTSMAKAKKKSGGKPKEDGEEDPDSEEGGDC